MSVFSQRMPMFVSGPALARAGIAALALVCLLQGVRLGLLLIAGPTLPAPTAPAAATATTGTTATALANWHLFGATPDAPPAMAASTLSLVLRGVFAGADPAAGLAFIADAAGHERAYAVGATLPGDAVLEAVHADHVQVRNGGRLERLALAGAATASGGDAAPAATSRPQSRATTGDPSGGFIVGMPSFGAPDLATARRALAPELAALAQSANLLPVTEHGRLIGVRIRVPDPALLERFGLGDDDVVTAVNGIPLDGPERRDALEQALRAGGIVTLTVRRGGAERQVSIGL